MTKRERAIIMAYTGVVTFTKDNIQYFLDYVKEKSGVELNILFWRSDGVPVFDFGSFVSSAINKVDKIRKACKKDFDELIKSSKEEESEEKDAKDDTLHVNGRRNGKDLFSKKMEALEHRFGRPLRPYEALLLIMFDSIKVDGKKDEDLFIKKIKALEQRLGRDLRPSEALLLTLFDSIDVDKVDKGKEDPSHIMPWGRTADLAITLALLDVALGKDLESKSKKASKPENEITLTACPLSEDTIKDLFKPMDECCCDKCDHKEKKMNNNESITGFKELDDALNSIPSDELDKILKAESEKKKSSSNHEFSDAIAEAALEICGIDLKTGRPKEE